VRASLEVGRRAVAVVVSCAGLAAGATACGTAQLSPPAPAARATQSAGPLAGLTAGQIARRAIADLAAVSSVRIAGSTGQDGQIAVLDVAAGAKGCTETLRIPGQGTSTLLQIGTTTWFKPSDQMWKWIAYGVPAAARRHLDGKYLQTPDVPAAMAAGCGRGELASAFGGELKDLVEGKITTIAGQPALQLAGQRHSTSAYVTISARPEFLRIDVSGQEHTLFTGYNRPLTLTPPPAGQTISTAQLGALGARAKV
jgi:hypothetical protein